MLTVTAQDMDWTTEKIAEFVRTRKVRRLGDFGFSGEHCSQCKATANVPTENPGWFCPCGAYNNQSWNHRQIPHETPTYGPTRETVYKGIDAGRAM